MNPCNKCLIPGILLGAQAHFHDGTVAMESADGRVFIGPCDGDECAAGAAASAYAGFPPQFIAALTGWTPKYAPQLYTSIATTLYYFEVSLGAARRFEKAIARAHENSWRY